MTSLVSRPQISLSLPYDCQSNDSLYKVWKVTREKDLAHLRASILRLNNRSWRLLNDRLLHRSEKKIDNSFLNLKDLPLAIPEQSSLASKASIAAERILRLDQPNLSESDIESSEISEYEDDFCCGGGKESFNYRKHLVPTPLPPRSTKSLAGLHVSRDSLVQPKISQECRVGSAADTKNIFFIANTPSPNGSQRSRSSNIEQSIQLSNANDPPLIKRQDSLFGGTNFNSNSAASQLSLSSTDISEDDEYSSNDEMEVGDDGDKDEGLNSKPATSKSSKITQNIEDESEWSSVSSDNESTKDSKIAQPLNFTKRIPIVSRNLANFKESTSYSDTKKDSPNNFRSRSLLSGLFLSDLASNSHSKTPFTKPQNGKITAKPVLKRSSTTGFMMFDKTKQLKESIKLQKPSILYSKRFASLADVTRKPSDYRSPVLFIEEEDNVKHSGETLDEEHMYTKQASSVSLSNFKVTAHAINSSTNLSKPLSSSPEVLGNTDNAEAMLSSSLNKYSNLHHVSSLKNILSKSSLHLTNLFSQARKLRPGQMRSASSSESLKFQRYNSSPSKDVSSLDTRQSPHFSQENNALNLPSPSQLQPIDNSEKPRIDVKVLRQEDFEPSIEISKSLKDSVLIDHKLGKFAMPERVIREELLLGGQGINSLLEENDDYHSKGW